MKNLQSFDEFLNESKKSNWLVFLPLKKEGLVDTGNSLFGVYSQEEIDKRKPYDEVSNFSISFEFPDMKIAQEYKELVVKAKGIINSPAFKKADEFENKNKVS
jgi:hypothetical protein